MIPDADTDLNKALHLADLADAITKRHYQSSGLHIDTKPDKSPVTQADLETEQTLSKVAHEIFGDSYIGEEAVRDSKKGRYWIVDPIDGTKNYMRGMPVWATLIGLFEDGKPLACAISAPALGRRWWAAKDQGAWTKDVDGSVRKINVSGVSKLEDASVMFNNLFTWDTVPAGKQAVIELLEKAWRSRAVSEFFAHMLVAEGAADAAIEPNMKEWDIAPLELLITEAGGSVWSNATPDMTPDAPRIVVTSNGKIASFLVPSLSKE
jgi:histidinol-phosphatase